MKKIFLIIAISSLIVGCAYKPLINPETSKDPATGENIAGNYWKDLHACRYIYKQNTGALADKMGIADKPAFIKKCMEDYGYAVLR